MLWLVGSQPVRSGSKTSCVIFEPLFQPSEWANSEGFYLPEYKTPLFQISVFYNNHENLFVKSVTC